MHLVFVIAPAGGPEANVKTLAPELEKRGHRVSVIYTVAEGQVDAKWSTSIRFRFAPPASAHYYLAKLVGSFHAWPMRLRAWEQAQAVRNVLREIQSEDPIDIVEVTEGFSVATLAGRWCVVVRAHGSDWTFRQFCGDGEAKPDRWLASQQRRHFLRAHSVTALSTHLSTYLCETLQLSSEIDPLPYGIDTQTFSPNSHAAVSPPILLTVGRLERRKGVDVLLRALPEVWRLFPDTEVRLVGNESDLTRSELLEMVPSDKRSLIAFPGFLNRDQLVTEYQHATIYVAPTQYETFGYTVLEAMACGRPVVSTRVGAIPELVEDGQTGLLAPWNDHLALAEAILKLLSNPARAARMGYAGRAKASNNFAVGAIVEQNLQSYRRALGGKCIFNRVRAERSKQRPGMGIGVVAVLVWVLLRCVDFLSGFVSPSRPRFLLATILPLLFFAPQLAQVFDVGAKATTRLQRINRALSRKHKISLFIIVLLAFAVVGYAAFLSRFNRGANMGDTSLFRQSIESTADFSGILYNDWEGGSHFKAHNSPFLLLLVPVVWIFGRNGWLVIQFLHSLVIVAWAYTVALFVGKITGKVAWKWPLIVSLFLATYIQHATFYDTRFAALGLALFVGGLLTRQSWRIIALGFFISMISRETAVVTIAISLLALPAGLIRIRTRLALISISSLWIVATALFISALGGPVSLGRFNHCLQLPSVSFAYVQCFCGSVVTDWPLKLAYTLRILSFSPAAVISPAAILAGTPDVWASWLSRDNILYSLNWHYYMPILGVVLLFGYHQIKRFRRLSQHLELFLAWTVATCLWQFFTTFRLNIF